MELDEMTDVLVSHRAGALVVTSRRSKNINELPDNILEYRGQICARVEARRTHASRAAEDDA
jgi:hypothetical protein